MLTRRTGLLLTLALSLAVACWEADEAGDSGANTSQDAAAAQPSDTNGLPDADEAADTVGPGEVVDAEGACSPALSHNRIQEADFVIITTDELAGAFGELLAWKWRKGIPTQVVTISEITAVSSGRDLAEQVRNFIRDTHQTLGASWFLLGGDTPLVPHREVHLTAYNLAEDAHLDDDIATDLYFADLDGDWDGDGDGIMAELEDGLDLMPDVYVGRLPARTSTDVTTYVQKVFAYERTPTLDYQSRALFLGGYAGTFNGELICSTLAFENTVQEIFPDYFAISKLYDTECGEYEDALPSTADNQRQLMNAGQNIIIDLGHGNASSLCNLGLGEIAALQNGPRPSVYLTTECNGCEFDHDSIEQVACEVFLGAAGGGVVYIGNTDFGPGFPWELHYIQIYLQHLFADPDLTVGENFAVTLTQYVDEDKLHEPLSDLRWTQHTLLLMGDPTLKTWTLVPEAPQVEVEQYETSDGVSVQQFSVSAAGMTVAGAVVSLFKEGEFLYTATTDGQGRACFAWSASGQPSSPYRVTVTGATILPYEEQR